MIKKNYKNYLIFLKKKTLTKKKNIKSTIQNNNNIKFKNIIFFNTKKNNLKLNKNSQLSMYKSNLKKQIHINRWEMYKLFYINELPNFKKLTK